MTSITQIASDIKDLPRPESFRAKLFSYSVLSGLYKDIVKKPFSDASSLSREDEAQAILRELSLNLNLFFEEDASFYESLKPFVLEKVCQDSHLASCGILYPSLFHYTVSGNPEDRLRRFGISVFSKLSQDNFSHYSNKERPLKEHIFLEDAVKSLQAGLR